MASGLEYNIDIKTAADLKAAEAYKRSLEAAAKAAKEAGKDATELSARLDAADRALQSNAARALKLTEALNKASAAEKEFSAKAGKNAIEEAAANARNLYELNKTAKSFAYQESGGGILGLLKTGAGQVAAAVSGYFALSTALHAVQGAIHEFTENEDALVKMQLALAAQGKYSEEAAKGIADLADQFEKATNIDGTTWLEQFTRLIQYGGRTQDIGKLGNTLKNLAGIMGGDVEGAASLLIRALNGNYRGFQQLGLIVDENKSQLENWNSIVKQTERGAGILEKQTNTLSGSWKRAANSYQDLEKALVQRSHGLADPNLLPIGISKAFSYLADKIGYTIPKVEGITNAQGVMSRTTEDASAALERQQRAVAKLSEEAEKAKRNLTELVQALDHMKGQDDKEATARKEFELALVDDEEKRTGNTLGAARKRYAIESRYSALQQQRENSADVAALTVLNSSARKLISKRNYLAGSVQYLTAQPSSPERDAKLTSAREELDAFDKVQGQALQEIRIQGYQRFADYDTRRSTYAFTSAASAVKENTTERGIRDQMASQALSNAQAGQAVGTFKDLQNNAAYIPGMISTAQGLNKLLPQLIQTFSLSQQQIIDVQREVEAINSRMRTSRSYP